MSVMERMDAEASAIDVEAAEVLEKAAALIEEQGWCQGQAVNGRGERCALGALQTVGLGRGVVLFNGDVLPRANKAVRDVIGESHVPTWNDRPNRTQDEVVDALRTAASNLRATHEVVP